MTLYGHNARAFEEWYRGESDSWWCVNCEEFHDAECEREWAEPVTINPTDYRLNVDSLAEYERAIKVSDEISSFTMALNGTLVSDDTVDMKLWLATHSVESAED